MNAASVNTGGGMGKKDKDVGYLKKHNNLPIEVHIFDKSKEEWQTEDQLLDLENCKKAAIGHPNFVYYFGCIENSMMKYHIFENLSRGNLLQVLRESGDKLDDGLLRKMFCQLLFVVNHLHDMDLVHRNLKLENVLVGEHYDIRLQGLAFLEKTGVIQNHANPRILSRTKFAVEYGPKGYRSPERMKLLPFNPFLDQVWALGVILYSMFHVKFPFSFSEGDEGQIGEELEKGVIFTRKSYPFGLTELLEDMFQPEEIRPRTWELLNYEWILRGTIPPATKRLNAIGCFTNEKEYAVYKERERVKKIRRQLFRRYMLFRQDMIHQPNFQRAEMERVDEMLNKAEQVIGHKPFTPNELPYNFRTLHQQEKLHKNEYWPSLFQFNPIKCQHFGIRRAYCSLAPNPKDVAGNLLKLQDKRVKEYPVPPNKNDPPKRPPLNLEYVDIDSYKGTDNATH